MGKTTSKTNVDQLDNLVLLRGIAALIVCFCHFAKPLSEGFRFSELFVMINEYGRYGVEMFFVISGFVIPLSFERGKYSILDYFTFLYKRLIRLHPTYIAAIVLTLIITYLSFKQRHEVFPENWNSVYQSVVFFNNLSFNRVFWTLFVEAQYYLFIGIFYVILKKYTQLSLFIIIPLLLLATQMPIANYIKLLKHLDFFLIGTVGFLIYIQHGHKIINYSVLTVLIIFSFIFCSIPGNIESVPAAIASLITIVTILFYKGPVPKFSRFLGKISYSLYLTHFPVGVKFVRLFMKILSPSAAWVLFFLAFILVIPVAWGFNKFIEDPSENISKRIKYRGYLKKTDNL